MKKRSYLCGIVVACALVAPAVRAEIKLPALFSDHMVLQAGERVPVWGWAKPAEKVSVEIGGRKLATHADAEGRWNVQLQPLKSGAHLTLTVQGENRIVVKEVLVGEVWLGSGQSNMGLRVREANNFDGEKAAADFPEIRMFTVSLKPSPAPLDDCSGSWQICSSNTVGDFSASLYFFGRELHRKLKTPVGLIHSSWGGTPIQPWISLETLREYPGYTNLLARKRAEMATWPARKAQLDAQLKAWETAKAEATALHQAAPPKPWNPGPPDSGQYMPAQLYNGMIHPLLPYGIRGATWYQGEANAGGGAAGAADYTDLLSRLIRDWRTAWGRGEFPFFFAQLPNWNNDGDATGVSWALFREGQADVRKVANTDLAVTIDIGDANNIHPKNKQEAGRRLALLALAQVYHQKVVCHGPEFSRSEILGATMKLHFSHTDGGLRVHGDILKGFVVTGADNQWHVAAARIEGDSVIVSSPEVQHPVAARYDWANNPDGNLFNGAGLPAMPFRTDHKP